MRTRTSQEIFEESIERLVREQVAGIRARVETALARGLGELAAAKPKAPEVKKLRSRSISKRRRTEQEIRNLTERLYQAVCSAPGSTMLQLAPGLGVEPRELAVAAAWLRKQGRVRTVGLIQHTRYFPVATAPKAR